MLARARVFGLCDATWRARRLAAAPVDFNREIRPILAANCFACHGPDAAEREADLRLDTKAGALADLGGHAAIAPGKPEASELVRRVATTDADELMPPAASGKKLTRRANRAVAPLGRRRRRVAGALGLSQARSARSARRRRPAWHNPIDRFVRAKLG